MKSSFAGDVSVPASAPRFKERRLFPRPESIPNVKFAVEQNRWTVVLQAGSDGLILEPERELSRPA